MNKIRTPKNRLRKLRTLSLGKENYEFQCLSKDNTEQYLIDLCSNDYFGLSRNKDIIDAAYRTSLSEGLGSGSSRFISGSRPIHSLLEIKLAKWIGKDKVILFPSGFQANIAAIQSLANRRSIIIADKFIHNSLLVGAKATGAKLVRFLHNDLNDLKKKLSNFCSKENHIIVVIESLYSMEGTLAPIKEIVEICKQYKVKLLVDEAHALGILGKGGKGLSNQFPKSVSLVSGSFGKSFGSGGAFLACNNDLYDQIIQTSGALRYTTALSPSLAAGALKSLEMIENNTSWGDNLLNFSKKWKKRIKNIDKFDIKGDCHILSLMTYDDDKTLLLQRYLEENGFLGIAIRPPSVPEGHSRIRITIRKTLTEEILEEFISVLKNYK